jgi:riboflavin kinase/FMN adenylyltransferase
MLKLIRGLHNLRSGRRGCVVTVGNFDGVHLGHQALVQMLLERARRLDLPAVVLTFEPQPQEYFAPQSAPARLTSLREKCLAFGRLGVDQIICLRFDSRLAALGPREFVAELLVNRLETRELIVGDDFRFGRDRAGDLALLEDLSHEYGFVLDSAPTCRVRSERVSSTRVRQALAAGDLELAVELIGRRYSLAGRVVHGDKRGRQLGFPTLNVPLRRLRAPLEGVFVSRAGGLGRGLLPAVSYVGTRPVFGGGQLLVETHVLDFDEDCYGVAIEVEFLLKLRDDQPFRSSAELAAQIAEDVESARRYFAGIAAQTAAVRL